MQATIIRILFTHRIMVGAVFFTLLLVLTVHRAESVVSEPTSVAHVATLYYPQTATSVPLVASGLVVAADEAIIRAQANGVVAVLPAYEGMLVEPGAVLVTQEQPIATAELVRAAANYALTTAEQDAAVSRQETLARMSTLEGESASTIAAVRTAGADAATNEAASRLLVVLKAAAVQVTASADFIDTHRSLFSSSGLTTYRTMLEEIFNSIPNYLADGITRAKSDRAVDLIAVLETLETNGQYDSVALLELAHTLDAQLTALQLVLKTGEATIFDERDVLPTSTEYTAYLGNQEEVLTTQDNLRVALAGLRSAASAAREVTVGEATAVAVSELDISEAARQAAFAATIARHAREAAAAAESVAAAQVSLGTARAPFAGIVAAVLVKPGAYVTVGTPLVSLVGSGARELTVHVPIQFAAALSVGQSYVVDGQIVGVVDRFSSVAYQGAVAVVIAVTEPSLLVGSSVTGTIMTTPASTLTALPYAYLHFRSTGAYVEEVGSTKIPVTIVYDDGTHYYIAETIDVALVPAASTAVGF